MRMKKCFLFVTLLIPVMLCAQQKLKTIEVSDTIIYATVDRPGDIYLVTKEGQIQKYDKDGKLVIVFKHKGPPTLFDPRDGARLFAYYREHQQYDYYNPSFEVTASYHIDPAFAIQPWLVCPSGDHKLWVLDKVDHSLKKLNNKHTEVEIEVLIDSTLIKDASAFLTMREYQGFVFILNPTKGILIFNSIGKHIKTIEEKGVYNFNFVGEELYFLKAGQVKFFNLFTAENRSMPLAQPARIVLFTDERLFLINHHSIDIFDFRP
jgi:hypothetical protein